ncbi:MAG: hypothetical protein U0821_16455 [Chloroflexota bacterium]
MVADPATDTAELDAAEGPRVIRRAACVYSAGALPGDWLQTWRRLDRLVGRSGLDVKVTLEPLDALPAEVDLLVAPPELEGAARTAAGAEVEVLVTSPSGAAFAFDELMRELLEGQRIVAPRAASGTTPHIVTYRGSQRID